MTDGVSCEGTWCCPLACCSHGLRRPPPPSAPGPGSVPCRPPEPSAAGTGPGPDARAPAGCPIIKGMTAHRGGGANNDVPRSTRD